MFASNNNLTMTLALWLGLGILTVGCNSKSGKEDSQSSSRPQGSTNDDSGEDNPSSSKPQGSTNDDPGEKNPGSENPPSNSAEGVLSIPNLHLVQGKVTLDGKPLANARVALHRIGSGASRVFAANTNTEGIYNIQALYSTGRFPGAPAGRYKVTVIKVAAVKLNDAEFNQQYQKAIEATTGEGKPAQSLVRPYLVDQRYLTAATTPFLIHILKDPPDTDNSDQHINFYNFALTSEPTPKK